MAIRSDKQSFSFPVFSRLAIVFSVLVLVVALVVIIGTTGEVEIQVKPTVTNRVVETFVNVSMNGSAGGTLPGTFEERTFERTVQVEGSQAMAIEQKARFAIAIHNQYSRDQSLVKTTRFLFNDRLYRLLDSVTVKAGTSIPAVVEADQSGAGFDLHLGDRLIIPGLWSGMQTYIFGVVDSELRPGVTTVQRVSQEQVDASEREALDQLRQAVRSVELEDPEELVFGQGGDTIIERPEDETVSNPKVLVKQTFSLLKVSKHALNGFLKSAIGAMEKDKAALLIPEGMTVEVLDQKPESARLHVTVPVGFYTPITKDHLDLGMFRGKGEGEIRKVLQEQYGIVETAVNYSPLVLRPFLSRIGRLRLVIVDP